jgi:uncharacterized protein (TIGR00369 family)
MSQPPSIFEPSALSQWVQSFVSGIPYARAAGMEPSNLGPGRATLSMPARPTWTGDAQRQLIHPGCASVLADTACGLAVGAALERIEPFATLDLRMDYLRPAVANEGLVCEAHCHRLSRSVGFVTGTVFQPGHDEPVARVNATFMRATSNARRNGPPPTAAREPMHTDAPAALPAFDRPALPPGRSPYVDYLGVVRGDTADGAPVFKLPFRDELIGNPLLPALHGGVLAGFAETALVLHLVATNPHQTDGPPRGVDFHIDYLRSAKPVDTYAACTTVRQGARVALVQVSLWQDDPRKPVCTARGHLLL